MDPNDLLCLKVSRIKYRNNWINSTTVLFLPSHSQNTLHKNTLTPKNENTPHKKWLTLE